MYESGAFSCAKILKMKYVVGSDEVGRGSLAGPVVVAAVLLPQKLRIRSYKSSPLRDSKRLTASGRENWFGFFRKNPVIKYTLAKVHPRKIEKINISRAANLAALRAYLRLTKNFKFHIPSFMIYLDGGLYLGNGKNRVLARTVIRGVLKLPAIKIASIIAKVNRDKLMTRLAKKYPRYGFEVHKGYGTRAHYAAIKKFGPSEIHRSTFLN